MEHAPHNLLGSVIRPGLRPDRSHGPLRRLWAEAGPGRIGQVLLVVLIWTAVGLFQTVPEMLVTGFAWERLVGKVIEAWTWALLTPAILPVDRRLTSGQQNIIRLLAFHLVLSVPFSLSQSYLAGLIEYPISEIWWSPFRSKEYIMYYFLGGWMTYWAIIGVLHTFKFHNRLLKSQIELERVGNRLLETRLNVLRLQLEPHFLFNTLNAISSEVAANPALAREMIEDLGALLRRSLDSQDCNEVALAQELVLLDRYLAIQKLRFGGRIDIRFDVDPETLSILVPSMLLQPLVENAIRHGIESRVSGGAIAITARRSGDELRIDVVDDGIGLPPRWRMETCAGLGLRVTQERLDALYSDIGDHGLTVSRRRGGGTRVAIRIPLRTIGTEAREAAA